MRANGDKFACYYFADASQFPRQHHSSQWVHCNFSAFPRVMIYVARDEQDRVIGYVQWLHKSGFRQEAVIELEQIAVLQSQQGAGVGTQLITESLASIKGFLADAGATLKAILVSTRTDNMAQTLYKKVLGAKAIAVIDNLYSHDEVIMIARDVSSI
jgi:ribosomal protein S18 acetylase RimI-like enzyme